MLGIGRSFTKVLHVITDNKSPYTFPSGSSQVNNSELHTQKSILWIVLLQKPF